jgi:hypothetical protein
VKPFTAIFFISVALTICTPKETMPMDLTQFQWKNRLLFLFAPEDNHLLFQNLQRQIMSHKAEVEDRDLVVFELLAQGPSRTNTAPLDRQDAKSIRDHFAIPRNSFSLILVGKDGGIKLSLQYASQVIWVKQVASRYFHDRFKDGPACRSCL